jgi:hypothetical protein
MLKIFSTSYEEKDWFFPKLMDYTGGGMAGFLTRKIKEARRIGRRTKSRQQRSL